MAYTHFQIPVQLTGSGAAGQASASGTGDCFSWSPCMSNVTLRRINILSTSTIAATSAPKFSIRKNTSVGVTSTTGQQLTTITMATGSTSGLVYYNSVALDTLVEPDEEITIACITAGGVAAQTVRASIVVDPSWEHPSNLTLTAATA